MRRLVLPIIATCGIGGAVLGMGGTAAAQVNTGTTCGYSATANLAGPTTKCTEPAPRRQSPLARHQYFRY